MHFCAPFARFDITIMPMKNPWFIPFHPHQVPQFAMNWHPKSRLILHLKMHKIKENSKMSIRLYVEVQSY